MKRLVILGLAAMVAFTSLEGCFGKFALTRKVYDFNGSVENKYLRSGVTWAFVLLPVYGLSALLDFAVFNTIEFWSGNNPVTAGEKDLYYSDASGTYRIEARKSADNVLYSIHPLGCTALPADTEVAWNLSTGNSTVTIKEGDRLIGTPTAFHMDVPQVVPAR